MGLFGKNKSGLSSCLHPDEHKSVGKVILLGVDEIAPNPAQPRRTFDLEALQGLADSIRLNGVLQPILVRKRPGGNVPHTSDSDKPYELISGERRLRASKLAGKETIPAVVMDASTRQSAVYAILENIQRKDLNLFEEAEALKTLIVEWGVTQEEAAVKLGMAQSTIANKIRLLSLSDTERQLILENRLTERHGRALIRLPSGENREKVIALIAERHLTVRETEELVERLLNNDMSPVQNSGVPVSVSEETLPPPANVGAESVHPAVLSKKRGRARKVMLVKDVRIFLNTVNQAIDAMKHAGIPAEAKREDHGEYIEYLVRIPMGAASGNKTTASSNSFPCAE